MITYITQGKHSKEIPYQSGTMEQVIKNYLRKVYDKLSVMIDSNLPSPVWLTRSYKWHCDRSDRRAEVVGPLISRHLQVENGVACRRRQHLLAGVVVCSHRSPVTCTGYSGGLGFLRANSKSRWPTS